MAASAATELIWHFAGYLGLPPDDNYTVKIIYEGGESLHVGSDQDAGRPHHSVRPGPDLAFGGRLDLPLIPGPDPYHWHLRPIGKIKPLPHPNPHVPHLIFHAPFHIPSESASIGGGAGAGTQLQITATYQKGGAQDLVDAHQINVLVNNNGVNAPAAVVAENNDHAQKTVALMFKAAADSVPAALLPSAQDTQHLKQFVDSNDAHPLVTQAQDAPHSVAPGQYVDGAPLTDGSNPHQWADTILTNAGNALNAGIPAPPTGDNHAQHIETVNVGSNIEANQVILQNYQASSVSLAVLGNYYETKAIIQTNVFNESDQVKGTADISLLSNNVHNVADFKDEVPTLTSGGGGTTVSGLNWSVDVLNGSLLDIHSLTQTNYLSNNNVVFEHSQLGNSQVIAGGNDLVNTSQFLNITGQYNFIIVEGNYHQDDLIYQTNVVNDSNKVTFGGQGAQTVDSGNNSVVNDGQIVDYGNHNFQPFNNDASAVVNALENSNGSLDPQAVSNAFPDLMGNAKVLIVTGDYYDVNEISQTNVISNSNVVHMTGGHGAQQTVLTGNNQVVNDATIVDGGSATSPYLQGNFYNDMMLIQTNIIGDGSKITTQDPSQLAPELVAFTGAGTPPPVTITTGVTTDAQHHHHSDIMSSMMH